MSFALVWTVLSIACFLALVLGINARFYRRPSIDPSDYPWQERAARETPPQMASALIKQMTLGEKLDQLSGDGGWRTIARLAVSFGVFKRLPHIYAGHNKRLRIPPLSFSDGPRGVVVAHATTFPVAMARGATWDPIMERRVAEAMGREARAAGVNYFGGVCVNLLRYPQWGRAQETWGEDPHHVGEMAAAFVQGVQHHNVMACVKHFAVNNIENSRFYVDVHIDARSLHEVHLPQFRRCTDAGAASIMSAYNQVNGDYCGHQRWLLEDVLRGQWGFDGFVSSDWAWGVHDLQKGIHAGLDVEMPVARVYRPSKLRQAMRRGDISEERVDEMVHRILRTRLAFASRPDPETYSPSFLANEAHQALAQEVAERSMVLLQNREACLPLGSVGHLAVIGELAVQANTGDQGSSLTSPPHTVTLLDGLRSWLGNERVTYQDGRDLKASAELAARCDAVVLVAGCWPQDEGENVVSNHTPPQTLPAKRRGGDRHDLALPSTQIDLIRAVGSSQKRSAVILIGGSAMYTDDWRDQVGAIVMAWYPGMMGGHALARLLSGAVDFSGRLPFAWPAASNRLLPFDAHAPEAVYQYHHGLTWFDHTGQKPAYALGSGLSYGQPVSITALTALQEGTFLRLSVTLNNPDDKPCREVIQCYIGAPDELAERHRKNLKAFEPVELAPAEIRELVLEVPLDRLRRFCPVQQRWMFDDGVYKIWVGPSSDEANCFFTELHFLNQSLHQATI